MGRAAALSRRDEAHWADIEAAIQLQGRRGVVLLTSDNPEVRAEILGRVRALAPDLMQIAPSRHVVEQIHTFARTARRAEEPPPVPVVWIEANTDHKDVWWPALYGMNLFRENLADEGSIFLILAGPSGLRELFLRAPDLRSVATLMCACGDEIMDLVTPTGPVSWLHLSDIHVSDVVWDQDLLLKALVRDLPGLLHEMGGPPNLVFVTGDVAYHGIEREYKAAHRFLGTLMEGIGLDPRQHLYVVPGNHDVDRTRIRRMVRGDQDRVLLVKDKVVFRDEIASRQGDLEEMGDYGVRLSDYCTATSELLGLARGVSPDRPWRTDTTTCGGLKVGVASLCSAWMCGPDDDRKGRIVLGERQVRDAAEELADATLRIALLHHPLSWLHEAEEIAVTELLRDRFHLVLHGHTHEAAGHLEVTPSSRSAVFGADALYAAGDWPRGFQVGTWDPQKGTLDLVYFTYNERQGGFWQRGPAPHKNSQDGRVSFPFSVDTLSQPDEQPAADARLAARIARASQRIYSDLSLLGVPTDAAQGTRGKLEEVYVPCDFAGSTGDDRRTLAQIQEQLQAKTPRRYVVLGDPGSGKTSLIRHMALCHRPVDRLDGHPTPPPATGGGAGEAGGGGIASPAPLVASLRDLTLPSTDLDLLSLLAADLSKRLHIDLTPSTLARLCAQGLAVLLVDGLDEVVDLQTQRQIRTHLASLAQQYPALPMLITSRIVGYEDVSTDLKRLPDHLFEHLRLEPFTDAQLDGFLARWSQATELDPVQRERKSQTLIAALSAEPRARELARNPLIATLIALVAKRGAKLPSERAQLYELLVQMLLETRPGAKPEHFQEQRLDEGRQRAVLERLALQMQEGRGQNDSRQNITIDRRTLEETLADLLAERELKGESRAVIDRTARRWVNWLAARTGLLVEQRPGVFAFLHLSVMEFLAGRALYERLSEEGNSAVAAFVRKHHDQQHWTETLLLMLGAEARRRPLMESVLGALLDEVQDVSIPRWNSMLFMLSMLRENLDLPGHLVNAILSRAAVSALQAHPTNWTEARKRIGEALQYSPRSGGSIQQWFHSTLRSATGDTLLSAVLLEPTRSPREYTPILASRADLGTVLGPVLDLLPLDSWGSLALNHSSRETLLGWMASKEPTVMLFAALLGKQATALAATGAAVLAHRSARLSAMFAPALRRPHSPSPAALMWPGLQRVVPTFPSVVPLDHNTRPLQTAQRARMRDLSWQIVRNVTDEIAACLIKDVPDEIGRGLAGAICNAPARHPGANQWRVYATLFPGNATVTQKLADGMVREMLLGPSKVPALPFTDWTPVLDRVVARAALSVGVPVATLSTAEPTLWAELMRANTQESALEAGAALLLGFVAEVHSGLIVSAEANGASSLRDGATLLATLRLQNRWLYNLFDPIANAFHPDPITPEQHALLLSLGLTQYVTTWRWPWGDRWHALMTAEPPEHWLPAFFWHQIQALTDPANTTPSLAAAEAALDRADWPELAAALRSDMLQPIPPEILARFDQGEPPPTTHTTTPTP